jgi:hypothetical protein
MTMNIDLIIAVFLITALVLFGLLVLAPLVGEENTVICVINLYSRN